jgi:hypothetical protein
VSSAVRVVRKDISAGSAVDVGVASKRLQKTRRYCRTLKYFEFAVIAALTEPCGHSVMHCGHRAHLMSHLSQI